MGFTPTMRTMRVHDPVGSAVKKGHDPYKDADLRLCADMYALLVRFYPGHYWTVHADIAQGIASIRIPLLMGPTAQYVLHLDQINGLNELAAWVRKAGGEILERWRIPRSSMDLGAFLDAKANRRLIGRNDPIPE